MEIKINPNKEVVARIREKLIENGGYCPCRLVSTEDTKCICKEFLEQEGGWCHCGLYYKENGK